MPAIAPIITAVALAAGATATAASIISTVVVVAATIAGSLLFSKKQKGRSLPNSLSGRSIMVREALVPRRIIYGRTRVGGIWLFAATTGSDNRTLHLVLGICEGPIKEIEKVFFNNDELELNPNGDAIGKYLGLASVYKHLGDEQDSEFESTIAIPSSDDFHKNNHSYVNGQLVFLRKDTNNPSAVLPSGLSENTPYFVINATTNTFQIASSIGGSPLPFHYVNTDPVYVVFFQKKMADAQLVSDVPQWTADHKLKGIAYCHIKMTYDPSVYATGVPDITFVVKGRKDIQDPRGSGSTGYTSNAALCAAHYLQLPIIGPGVDFQNDINQTQLIAAANTCDEVVNRHSSFEFSVSTGLNVFSTTLITPHNLNNNDIVRFSSSGTLPSPLTASTDYYVIYINKNQFRVSTSLNGNELDIFTSGAGTHSCQSIEKRYEANGVIFSEDNAEVNLIEFREAFSGNIVPSEGKWNIYPGEYIAPTFNIEQKMVTDSIVLRTRAPRRDRFNRIKGTFISEASGWQPSDFPSQEDSNLVTEDGEILVKDLELSLVSSPSQAQRIARIDLLKTRSFMETLELTCNIEALPSVAGKSVSVTLPRFGFNHTPFDVVSSAIQGSGEGAILIKLSLKRTDPSIYEYDAATVEKPYRRSPDVNIESIKLPSPTASPGGGIYTSSQYPLAVTLTNNATGSFLRYAINGTVNNSHEGTYYTGGAITINSGDTLRARAFADEVSIKNPVSDVMEEIYSL